MTTSTDRRKRILEAAQRLFCHYGPGKTTIGDIAREVGIGVGSVYLEFCSKDAIVTELARERQHLVLSRMRAASTRGSPAERLRRVLEARVVALFDVAAEGAHSCDLVACSASRRRPCFDENELLIVRDVLDFGTRQGHFDCEDAMGSAELIAEAFAALSPPSIFERSRDESVTLARALSSLLIDGIASRSTVFTVPNAKDRARRRR